MFTGLVESVGEIAEVKPTAAGVRLRIATALAPELKPGDSLAVNGVCLTVILADATAVHADVGPETLRVTTLGTVKRDSVVNLERPPVTRLDKHRAQLTPRLTNGGASAGRRGAWAASRHRPG